MQITPELKAQLEAQKEHCIFCKIVKKEVESQVVFEDDLTLATLDIFPAVQGHAVFFLKEHYPIMPYIQPHEFNHLFGLLPQMSKAIQQAMVRTGMNIFIANGGVAGQQASHFLVHLLPREAQDGFLNFWFNTRSAVTAPDKARLLQQNLPIMLANHFKRQPAAWHTGKGNVPGYLAKQHQTVVYEDEQVLAVLPQTAVVEGHIEIYSKASPTFTSLATADAAHLFYVASYAATAIFEGLGAQGTNIIVKSGNSDDHNDPFAIHILPRKEGDGLQSMQWGQNRATYDLKGVAAKIKEQSWQVKYEQAPLAAAPAHLPKMTPAQEIQQAIDQL